MGRGAVLSVAILVGISAAGCAKKADDATLATQIKSQMFSDPQLNGASLEVTSKDGQVTLAGAVPNDAARYKAYKIANETAGVAKVNDQMTVAPTPALEPNSPTTNPAPASIALSGSPPARAADKARKARTISSPHPADDNQIVEDTAAPQQAPPELPAAPDVQQQPVPPATPQAVQPPLPTPPPPQPRQVEVPASSTLTVRMIDGVDASVNSAGEIFHASLESPLVVDNDVVVPRGADIYVRLVSASSAGRMKGKSELHLELVKMEFQGRSYPLVSSTYSVTGSSAARTPRRRWGGAALGAIIGAIAGGGKGAGIGAGVGAAGGAIYQGATKGKQVKIPAETRLDFQLDQPVTVTVLPRPSNSVVGQQ